MHLYSTKCSCFSFGKHLPAISHLCNKSCEVLAEGRGVIAKSQECQCVPQGYRTVRRSVEMGGQPPPHWHHWDAEYFHVTSQNLCPKNTWGFMGNTLHCLKGGSKSTYLPQGCTQLMGVEAFPLGKIKTEKFSHSVDLWGYRNCKRYWKKITLQRRFSSTWYFLCKPVFEKKQGFFSKCLGVCVYKVKNPKGPGFHLSEERNKLKAKIQILYLRLIYLDQSRSVGIWH